MKLDYNVHESIGMRANLEKDYGTWSIIAPSRYTDYCFEIALIIDDDLVELKGENDQIKRLLTEEDTLTFIESYVP